MDIALQIIPGAPRLAVDVAGAGELVLFLHGIGGNRSNWSLQIKAVAEIGSAVAWDLRGYGASDDYPGPLRMEDVMADIERVRRHFHAERLHLVGLSLGGVIALAYAGAHAARVASLTLCATTTALADLPLETQQRFLEERRAPLLRGLSPADIAPAIARSLAGPNIDAEALAALEASIAVLRRDSYLKTLDATVAFRPSGTLQSIDVPTLVVSGGGDRLVPVTEGRRMAASLPNATHLLLPGCGHIVNLEQPMAFNAALLAFLRPALRRVV